MRRRKRGVLRRGKRRSFERGRKREFPHYNDDEEEEEECRSNDEGVLRGGGRGKF